MSEADTGKQSHYTSRWLRWANPAEPWSTTWRWQMRILNINIWMAPLIVLAVAGMQFKWPNTDDTSIANRLMFSLPWVGVALGAAALAHALYRIESNLEGGGQPFTQKNESIYRGAVFIDVVISAVTMLTFLVLIFYTLIHALATSDEAAVADGGQLWTIFNAMYPPLGAMYLLGMFTRTLRRTHFKARTYYEELEQGV